MSLFASIRNVLTDEIKVNTLHCNGTNNTLNLHSNNTPIGTLNETQIDFNISTETTRNSVTCATDRVSLVSNGDGSQSKLSVSNGIVSTKGSMIPESTNVDSIGTIGNIYREVNVNIANATELNITSDSRLKNNIKNLDVDFCKNLITKLRPVSYNLMIDEDERTSFGFIAQEVQGAISDHKLKLHNAPAQPNGYHSLNYIELISPIIKILQELITRVNSLEKK